MNDDWHDPEYMDSKEREAKRDENLEWLVNFFTLRHKWFGIPALIWCLIIGFFAQKIFPLPGM